jgi:hypothetical protein
LTNKPMVPTTPTHPAAAAHRKVVSRTNSMDEMAVLVGSGSQAQITLSPTVRSHQGTSDYWDGNWVQCNVSVRAGGFRGEYVACLRTDEFVSFRADLERLYRDLRGTGGFHSMEEWVDIEVRGDGRGHFTGLCRLKDRAGDGNLLECEVEFDQTDVPAMLEQLRKIEAAFSVMGSPAG